MCGIAAIYAYNYPALDVDRSELRAIREYMLSRGPDGRGEWFSENRRVGLGHRRLAIIDPDQRANQPMLSDDGKLAIVFNGEIYNFRELRQQLFAQGHLLRTESDTEVLLHLYTEKREKMLHDLRGMFAFAIWDEHRQAMFLARDSYGIKPLYYADDGWTLRVASQVKALLAGGKVSREPEPAGIAGFHLFGSVPEPFTLYQEIRQLPAGHFLWADALGAREPRCWVSIPQIYTFAEASPAPVDDLPEALAASLLDAVRAHLVSDVPVGAFLSAGIDSGSLVGLMRDAGAKDIQTVTVSFDEFRGTENDEAPPAQEVARQFGTRHVTRRVSRAEFEQDLPAILHAMDQPSIDGVNTWFVSKAAAEQGLKVVVSGLGGDELFGGYPSFRDIPKWVKWLHLPGAIPFIGIGLRKVFAPLAHMAGVTTKAAGLLEFGGTWDGAYLLRRGLFMPWELPEVMGAEVAREGLRRLRPLNLIRRALQPRPQSAFAAVACLESTLYLRNQLLRDADWAGMAHSLEIRVPLVDAKLLACIAALAVGDKDWSKERLAGAPSHPLSRVVTDRTKTGFTTPIPDWMIRGGHVVGGERTHWSRSWSRAVFDRCYAA